ncbi:MAG: hypothetical protein K6E99_05975 [Bacilli bacterium]|nr:hypothetical protein [Bacilli bacterium]
MAITYNSQEAKLEKKPTTYQGFTYDTETDSGCINKFEEVSKLILDVSNDVEELGNKYTSLQAKYDNFTDFNDKMNSNKNSLRNSVDNIKKGFDSITQNLNKQVTALQANDASLMTDLESIAKLISNSKDQDKTISDSRNKNDGSSSSSGKSDEDKAKAVDDVIKGKYGSGDERKEALRKDGFDPDEIQKMVNNKLNGGGSSSSGSSETPTNGSGQEGTTQPTPEPTAPSERPDTPKDTTVSPDAGFVPAMGDQLETVYKIIAAEGGSTNPAEAVNIAATMINRARKGGYGGGNNIYGIATAEDQYVVYQNGDYASASLSPESRVAVEQLFASCSQGGPTPHDYTSFRSNGSEKYGGTILEPGGNRYK